MIFPNFDKTAKGREEIATRAHRLPSRLRALLLLFDGKRTSDEVLQKVAGIGLTEQNISELLDGGFIQRAHLRDALASPVTPAAAPTATPAAALALKQSPPDQILPPDGQTLLQILYNFYTETIRNTIGLRGYALQIKVERARSVDDFRKMRLDYLTAVEKAQGAEAARSLDLRLQKLLQMETLMESKAT